MNDGGFLEGGWVIMGAEWVAGGCCCRCTQNKNRGRRRRAYDNTCERRWEHKRADTQKETHTAAGMQGRLGGGRESPPGGKGWRKRKELRTFMDLMAS